MADTKITALAAIATVDPAADVLPIVDISDTSMAASGTTKKVTSNQILGAGGTATLASAAITGDLTVDTNTLKVDSTNNRVIVGHTSGSAAFQVTNAGAAGLEIQPTGFSSAPLIQSYNRSGSAYTQLTLDGSTIVHALSGSTAMTLNSTGLGIGIAPDAGQQTRLSVYQTGDLTNEVAPFTVGNTAAGAMRLYAGVNNTNQYVYIGSVKSGTSYGSLILQPNGGNLGIGVAPSAWGGSYKALQLQSVARSIASTGAGVGDLTVAFNAIYDSTDSRWEYAGTGDKAGRYSQTGSGNHRWFVSNTAGTAGNEITDFASAAMTLDASGNLLVGTTSVLNSARVSLKAASVATVLSLNGVTGDTAQESFVINKFDSNSTTSQVFARFTNGNGASGSGQINGNGANACAFGTFSDSRLKENILSLPSQLANILSLRPVEFDYKDGSGHQIGFVAQEIQEVYSDAVGEQNGFLTVTGWSKTEARLVSAIKELAAKVQALEAKLA